MPTQCLKEMCCASKTMPSKSLSVPSSGNTEASAKVLERKGTTMFASPSPTYRYLLSLKSGKLVVWLEDCESKAQWCTTQLSLEDYVNANNKIPHVKEAEYVEYFHKLLTDARKDKSGATTFRCIKKDAFRLEMTVEFQALMQTRTTTYSFDLALIPLDKVDVLVSKVQDLMDSRRNDEEKIKELQDDMKKMQEDLDERDAEISQLTAKLKNSSLDKTTCIQKSAVDRENGLILWITDTQVNVRIPGTYQITVIVNFQAIDSKKFMIELMKNGVTVQCTYSGHSEDFIGSSTLVAIARVTRDDMFSVRCPVNLMGCSYMTLLRVGD